MAPKSTDRAWCKFGEVEPYFGVLTQPRFRRGSITDADLDDFFQSGADYVKQMLAMASERVDAPRRYRRALDFGCGVARLTMPLSEHAEEVVGVDVAPSMLSEARANCERHGVTNATFIETDAWVARAADQYDLVHTFIVLQHLPPTSGLPILAALIDRIAPGGVGVVHLTYGKAHRGIRWISWVKKQVPLAHNVINVLRGRMFRFPMMQMNDYDLNRVFRLLQLAGVPDCHAQFTDHGGYLGVSLYFRKPVAAEAALAA